MTADELAALRSSLHERRLNLETELFKLNLVADKIRAEKLEGVRDISVAITNIETGLLWLQQTADKI